MDSNSTSSGDESAFYRQPSPTTLSEHLDNHGSNTPINPLFRVIDSKRSPAAISLRAFFLGLTLGVSLTLAFQAIEAHYDPLWRAWVFLAALAVFHFLEFYITARYNPPAATVSAFLLSQNGYAYNVAHALAFLECVLRSYVAPQYFPDRAYLQPIDTLMPSKGPIRAMWLTLGFAMLALGQGIRSFAMAHAGTNFNHLVQSRKKAGHVLVTDGIYAWLRHPSYFGFFWWGLATQLIMGNVGCLAGYAVVLWRFFKLRIESMYS
ncbi:MAG: hypothetical protein Q9183_000185 [Haloplaca sp. 2 TL-2023]